MSRLHLSDPARPQRTHCGLRVAAVRLGGLQADFDEENGRYLVRIFAEGAGEPCADCLSGQLALFAEQQAGVDKGRIRRSDPWGEHP